MSLNRKIVVVKGKAGQTPGAPQSAPEGRDYSPGRSLPGGYVIDDVIGEGGSSLVLKAHKPNINPPIYKAIKVINTRLSTSGAQRAADVQREYYGEAKVSYEIGSDPYAISVEDILEMPDGSRALVCPYIRGHTLRALIRDHVARGLLFPFELTAFVFHRILSVLVHARERGIAHRDLCPNNIMVQRTGVPLLLDWGASSESDETVVIGKPAYLAPEMVKQYRKSDREALFKADMFSLGAVVREMLIGFNNLDCDVPKNREDYCRAALEFRSQLDTDTLTPVGNICADIPQRLSDIVYTCTKEDPSSRLDAEDLYDYLGSEYLYTPQIGFGVTAETLKNYLTFFYSSYDPANPLPDTRQGRNLWKVIASKVRKAAERPEYRDFLLQYVVEKEGIPLTLGSVGRTFTDAFGQERVEAATLSARHRHGADAGHVAIFREIADGFRPR